jgi:hypothetical protein
LLDHRSSPDEVEIIYPYDVVVPSIEFVMFTGERRYSCSSDTVSNVDSHPEVVESSKNESNQTNQINERFVRKTLDVTGQKIWPAAWLLFPGLPRSHLVAFRQLLISILNRAPISRDCWSPRLRWICRALLREFPIFALRTALEI